MFLRHVLTTVLYASDFWAYRGGCKRREVDRYSIQFKCLAELQGKFLNESLQPAPQ